MSKGNFSAWPALLLAGSLLLAGCGSGSEPQQNTGGGQGDAGTTQAETGTVDDAAERNLPKPVPPLPEVEIDGAKVSVRHGSYCWAKSGGSVCVDMIGGKGVWTGEDGKRPPVPAAPGAKVLFTFKNAPRGYLHATRESDSTSGPQSETLLDGTLTLPQEKGVYYYSVGGNWPEGSAEYVLGVEVR